MVVDSARRTSTVARIANGIWLIVLLLLAFEIVRVEASLAALRAGLDAQSTRIVEEAIKRSMETGK